MAGFLFGVMVLSYLVAVWVVVITIQPPMGSDIQLILAALLLVCGTVAAVGFAIVMRIDDARRGIPPKPPAEM